MIEILKTLNWNEILITIWTVILLPVLTYAGNEFREWSKAKKIDKYTDILEKNVYNAVKDVYETVVKDIKTTDDWTIEKQNEVKELAKSKAINALTYTVYECLKNANVDFEEYLDSLIGTALFNIKNSK